MRKLSPLLLILQVFAVSTGFAQFQFLSPVPGAVMINPEHNIIIREGNTLDRTRLKKELFHLQGSKSGIHAFDLIVAADGKTIILNPQQPFDYDETVSVSIGKGLRITGRKEINPLTFSFSTHRRYTKEELIQFKEAKQEVVKREFEKWSDKEDDGGTRDITGMFEIITNLNPSAGDIFFDVLSGSPGNDKYVGYHIVTVNGDSVYSKANGSAADFKMNTQGNFGVSNEVQSVNEVLDSNFQVIDKFYPANGYPFDEHEFLVTADGHAFLIADEYQVMDLTVFDPTYNSQATVIGSVIQEFDKNKNLVFEWRSFDHVEVTEAFHEHFANSIVDYMHMNSLDIDNDGNLLVSIRHLDQVAKISPLTGEFIWRMGGVNNEFTFIDEPEPFTYQHDVRRIANGHITLYDNGNYHSPTHSSAKEYVVDEVNKTATLFWSYSHPKSIGIGYWYYFAMGNVQRLANGNTFINWGWRSNNEEPNMTEVTPYGTIVWELHLSSSKNLQSYRANKYVWDPCARPTIKKMKSTNIMTSSAQLKWSAVANAVEYHLQYKKQSEPAWTEKIVNVPQHSYTTSGLAPNTKYLWRLETWCMEDGSKVSGYTAKKKFTTLLQQPVQLIEDQAMRVSVWPNPAHDQIRIQYDRSISEIRLWNLIGREVMHLNVEDNNANPFYTLSVNGLEAGTYLLEIVSDQHSVVRKVLVE